MAPDLCSRCVSKKIDLQGIHEDCGGMCISSKIRQMSAHPEVVSEIYDCKPAILDTSPSVAFLATMVRVLNSDDWEKVSLKR